MPAPEDQSWFLYRDGEQHGPYAGADILRLAESGQLRADDLLWKPGLDGWKPLHAIAGLAAPPSGAGDAIYESPGVAAEAESAAEPVQGEMPGERSAPGELEPTWKRVVALWWLILWRTCVASLVVGLALSLVVGLILQLAGFEESAISAVTTPLFWLVFAAVLLPVMQMALKKHYQEFRIALAPRDAP